MAKNQNLSPEQLREALSLLKQLKRGYEELGQENIRLKGIDATNLEGFIKGAGGVKNILKQWTIELDTVEDQLDDLGKNAKGIFTQFSNIVGEIKKSNQNLSIGNKAMNSLQDVAEKLKNDQQGITDLNKKDLLTLIQKQKQSISNLDIANKALKNQIENNELSGKELENAKNLVAEREKEATAISDLNGLLQDRLKEEEEIESKTGLSGKLLEGFKKIPVLGDVLDIEGAKEAMRDAAKTGASSFSTLGAGIKALGPSLKSALGPLALISLAVKTIQEMVGAMFESDKRITSLSRNLQISKNEAQGIDEYFKSIKGSLETEYKLTKEIYEAQSQLSELSATSNLYSKETLDAQIQLTKEYGLQAEDAANLNKLFIVNGEKATDSLNIAARTTKQFFKQNGILFREKELLQQASKISGQLLVSFKGSTTELIKSVAQANKLGITLDQAKNISESMLDFEQSISSELEAELLTGKELNLDRARALSLQGKFTEAADEALKSVGSLNEFQNLNVIQQQSLAKAAGLTVDQLSDALIQQKLIDKEQKQQYQRLKAAGNEELARKFALKEYNEEEIKSANKRLDAQEKFNLSMDKIKEVFTDLVDGGVLDSISNAAMALADTIQKGGSIFSLSGKSDLTKNLEKKSLEQAQKTSQELTEKQKSGEKLNQREIETLNKANSRLNEEQDKQKSQKMAMAFSGAGGMKFAEGGIVNKPVTNATIGEAGPEAVVPLNQFYKKLDELIIAVKSGGNIYLDGTKVGTAMATNGFRVQ